MSAIKTALIGSTRVPAISLGTWSWGDKTWGYQPEDLDKIREAWFACLEDGYPFFDTAEVGRGGFIFASILMRSGDGRGKEADSWSARDRWE